jgi:hypothetical protein
MKNDQTVEGLITALTQQEIEAIHAFYSVFSN